MARLLQRHGVAGIEARIRDVMACYVRERGEDRADDRMLLLVRTLREMVATGDIVTCNDINDVRRVGVHRFKASEVPAHLKTVADQDADTEWATSRNIGKMLASLRISQAKRKGNERGWLLSRAEADDLARSYGIEIDARKGSTPTPPNVTNVIERHDVTVHAPGYCEEAL